MPRPFRRRSEYVVNVKLQKLPKSTPMSNAQHTHTLLAGPFNSDQIYKKATPKQKWAWHLVRRVGYERYHDQRNQSFKQSD